MKKTPLYDVHNALGGRIIDFGGWALPVQYTGILEEHRTVRTAAGLFDVSHMGEITVRGKDAEKFIRRMLTNDITTMSDFQVMYSPMCYPHGGTVDDLLVYRFGKDDFLLVVNASNTAKDFEWLKSNAEDEAELCDVSADYAQIALQGPESEAILRKVTAIDPAEIGFFRFRDNVDLNGVKALVSRTGYTGEDGFEIYVNSEAAVKVWNSLMEAGRDEGLVPVGLGARDTLRFEAALPLYGQEISQDISPLEAALGRFVKLDSGEFIGREALLRQKEQGVPRKLAGFEMVDKGVPRSHYEVLKDGKNAGFVTTGSFSPSLGKNIGLALIKSEYALEDGEIEVVVRDKALKARIVKIPFYKKNYKK